MKHTQTDKHKKYTHEQVNIHLITHYNGLYNNIPT